MINRQWSAGKGSQTFVFCKDFSGKPVVSRTLNNPQLFPVTAIDDQGMPAAERMTVAGLRQRFRQTLDWQPEINVDEQSMHSGAAFRPASVLIPVVNRAQPSLLLTQRAANLQHHAGQISFPGGRFEESDASLIDTALRETEEEVGLSRQQIEVLGVLPEYRTGTGYLVTPVVAIIEPPFEIRYDEGEVASVFEVPLAFLMDGKHHERRLVAMPDGRERHFYAMPYEQHFIWGATAGMLRNLYHFLRA